MPPLEGSAATLLCRWLSQGKILRLWTSQNSTYKTVILVLTSLCFCYSEGKVSDSLVRFQEV